MKRKMVTEIEQLETEKDALKNEIVNTKVDNGTAKYVVTLNMNYPHLPT